MSITHERKRLWLAIAGSLFVHLLVAFSLAAFGRISAPLPDPDDAPMELTMVDLSATPPPAPPSPPKYVETNPSKESAVEPKEKTFESNANSLGKSSATASGDLALPSQEGKDRPFLQLETQRSSLAAKGAQAQLPVIPPPTPPPPTPASTPLPTPKPKPSATPKSMPLPEPSATPPSEMLAMLATTPPPAWRDAEALEAMPPPPVAPTPNPALARPKPESQASSYQPEKEETRITGRITDRGPSSVNAVATPLGRYQKIVSDAIGSRWYYFTKQRMDMAGVGTAIVEAEIDRAGKVQNLRLISNSSNESFANICLQSFQEAHIPPIPSELVATLPEGRLQVNFSFTMYAN